MNAIAKILLLFWGITALSHPLYAQEEEGMYENRTFYGGLLLGTNWSQVDGDNFAGYARKGLNVGGIVYLKIGENVALSLEVLLSQKGARSKLPYEAKPGIYITKYGVDFNYAQIPIMINYYDRRKSHFGGGFSYSRLASVNEYVSTNPPATYNIQEYPFRKYDISFLVGADLHIWKGLFFNPRFEYSLLPIRDGTPTIYAKRTQYNNTWVFRLMYLFM